MKRTETEITLNQAIEINLNYIKHVARFVFYAMLFILTLTMLEASFIFLSAAGLGVLNWVLLFLIISGLIVAIRPRKRMKHIEPAKEKHQTTNAAEKTESGIIESLKD
jgi:hypothetical protein